MIAFLFLGFGGLVILGIPVAIALTLSSALTLLAYTDVPLFIVAQRYFMGINSFSYMGIPLFMLAGNIMGEAQISERLVRLASLIVGRFTGGLAHVTTGACAFFGAISGSSPATTAAIGSIMIPAMEKEGYDKAFSASVAAASGILGNIIPPSLTMVVFGVTASVSIGSLFLSGIIPGIMIALMIMSLNFIICKKRKIKRKIDHYTIGEALRIVRESLWALLVPFIILGGIYMGIFTATESAAVACAYGIIVGMFVYRTLSLKSLFNVFKSSIEGIALIFLIMAAAALFSFIIAREEIPQQLAGMVLGFSSNHYVIMFLLLIGLLIVGTFLDSVGSIVLVTPTLIEVVRQAGIDPLYFGVFLIIALGVGQITPPVGLCLYVATNISKVRFEAIVRQAIPFICVYVIALIIFIFCPKLLTLIKM
jgi:C4-dicarboxylate transporter DctM subunit